MIGEDRLSSGWLVRPFLKAVPVLGLLVGIGGHNLHQSLGPN